MAQTPSSSALQLPAQAEQLVVLSAEEFLTQEFNEAFASIEASGSSSEAKLRLEKEFNEARQAKLLSIKEFTQVLSAEEFLKIEFNKGIAALPECPHDSSGVRCAANEGSTARGVHLAN
jgi:hypothetical protein